MSINSKVYLPFFIMVLFMGPVFYSPPDQNHFKSSTGPFRHPATGEDKSCLKLIAKFYPTLSEDFIAKRIELNDDFHSFYRAFVPLFYRVLKNEKEFERVAVLKKYVSTIGGDVHSENFGFIIDDKGKVFFSLNDCDDTAEGPLYLDVFRHFISANIVTKDIDWKEYLKAYNRGINEEKSDFSKHVQKMLDTAVEKTQSFMEESISLDPPKFIKMAKPNRAMTSAEVASVKKGLEEKYPQIEIFDQYARIKIDGGSAGMKRYQVLARVNPNEEIKWLDVKETTDSSYDKVFMTDGKSIDYEKRLANLKENAFAGRLDQTLSTINVSNQKFSLRAKNNFAITLKLEDIKEKNLPDILLDEAYVLGRFHANSLRAKGFKAEDYLNDWDSISSSELKEVSDLIKDDLKKLYKESK